LAFPHATSFCTGTPVISEMAIAVASLHGFALRAG
jgi:hypothetical protein